MPAESEAAAYVKHSLDVTRVPSKVPGTPPESWVATCECGWTGHPRYSASEAISDHRWHRG